MISRTSRSEDTATIKGQRDYFMHRAEALEIERDAIAARVEEETITRCAQALETCASIFAIQTPIHLDNHGSAEYSRSLADIIRNLIRLHAKEEK